MLYVNTIRRMRPGMILARLCPQRRVAISAQDESHSLCPVHLCIPELDLAESYTSRFDVSALLQDEFLLINERHHVDFNAWNVTEASHLWNFNLHYFEYGIALAAAWKNTGDEKYIACFKRLIISWIDACPYAEGDAWHPYTISLRIINWMIALDLFGDVLAGDSAFTNAVTKSMYLQYLHLLINQEKHLRANHYWENLKTLLICSVAFGERDVYGRVLRDFEGQLNEQILSDGVHFERSLMYHKLVLEGMLRVWLAANQADCPLPKAFIPKAQAMLNAMVSLEKGMGKTPFFNDAADGVAKDCNQLVFACKRVLGLDADDSLTAFPDAGYYKLYNGDIAVMFDAGEPGPSYMLGHAHCDCLSFELSYKGRPVIVNSGTYAYQSELRPYFRSTAAHNTVMVDGEEQMECWGEHRVGKSYRDVRVIELSDKRLLFEMTLSSGTCLHRLVALLKGKLEIADSLVSEEGRSFSSYLHFTSGISAEMLGERIGLSSTKAHLVVELESCRAELLSAHTSPLFGVLTDCSVIVMHPFDGKNVNYSIEF